MISYDLNVVGDRGTHSCHAMTGKDADLLVLVWGAAIKHKQDFEVLKKSRVEGANLIGSRPIETGRCVPGGCATTIPGA